MRTELELSMKFIVDPKEPISEHEVRALASMYEVLRSLQTPPPQLTALGQLVERCQPKMTAAERWAERQQRARDALARHDDKFQAARSLAITTNELMKWIAGPKVRTA